MEQSSAISCGLPGAYQPLAFAVQGKQCRRVFKLSAWDTTWLEGCACLSRSEVRSWGRVMRSKGRQDSYPFDNLSVFDPCLKSFTCIILSSKNEIRITSSFLSVQHLHLRISIACIKHLLKVQNFCPWECGTKKQRRGNDSLCFCFFLVFLSKLLIT